MSKKLIIVPGLFFIAISISIFWLWSSNKLFLRISDATVDVNGARSMEAKAFSGNSIFMIIPVPGRTKFPVYIVDKESDYVGINAREDPSAFSEPIILGYFALCLDCETYLGGPDRSSYRIISMTPSEINFEVYRDFVTVKF